MNKRSFKVFSLITILALMLMAMPMGSVQAVSTTVVISQVYGGGGNTGAPYTNDFVELFNRGTTTVSLSGWSIQYASATGTGNFGSTTALITPLSGSLAPGQYLLVQEAASSVGAPLPTPDVTDSTPIPMSASAGKVALVNTTTSLGCNGGSTPCSSAQLAQIVDLVGYGNANFFEGSGAAPTLSNTTGALRLANGCTDTDNNSTDFIVSAPAPRNTASPISPCPTSIDLSINDVSTSEGNSGTTTFTFAVSLSLAAGVGGVTFDIATADGTAQDDVPPTEDNDYVAKSLTGQTIPAGSSSYSFSVLVNGDTAFEPNETFSVNVTNVTGATVADGQGQGTIINDDVAISYIHDIQGSGSAVTGPGPFTVEAIVVGDYQTQGSGQLRGFFLQEEDADVDANPATSEGIFVFCSSCPTAVSVGDKVRVTGGASEFFDMSQLSATTAGSVSVLSTGNPLPLPASVQLPVPNVPTGNLAAATAVINAYFEAFEGMLVTFPDTLSVSEYFELARYGQVILTEGGRPRQFTDANLPSPSGLTDHEIDLATRTIILDDTDNRQNRPVDAPNTSYYHPVPGLSITNYFRGGDTITNLSGVLHWSFAGQSGTDAWRIRPVTEAYSYAFTSVNPRPQSPNVGGSLKVASFNVLNYFLTVDTTSSNSVGTCGASGTLDCRGADSTAERDQQQAKLTEALKGLDADVVGLIELENTPNVDPLAEIVSDLNAATSPDSYAAINTGLVGTDAIKVGFIYKPGEVTPVGTPMIDNDPVFSRPPVAQFFETTDGARFTVVINHFKSKGCDGATGADLDQLDGQGCFNAQRVAQASALINFVNNIVGQTGDPDVLIIGDLNSYAKEDPITTLINAGFTNLVQTFGGSGAYSYVFDGQLGYLDHALANSSLLAQITGTAEWHINADEIPLFDYNDDVRDTGEASFEEESDALPLYEQNPYRTSDHDPVIVGLNPVNQPPTADAGGPYTVVEGSSVTLNATGIDPEGTTVTFEWDLDNDGTFETPGQSVSFAPSAVAPATLTVKLKVTDAFGNFSVDEATVSVLYNFSGFFQPVDNDGVVNTVKAGQAVPVKFSLNGDHGLVIFADGYPKFDFVACPSSPADGIEETLTAGNSSLSYDPTTDQYTYVWKTEKGWAGRCGNLQVMFNDGTTLKTAVFRFTK